MYRSPTFIMVKMPRSRYTPTRTEPHCSPRTLVRLRCKKWVNDKSHVLGIFSNAVHTKVEGKTIYERTS
jgi:hypothetical protein